MTPATLKIDANSPPNAVIDAPSTVKVCDTVSLDGTKSTDSGSAIKTYDWRLDKPEDSKTSLSNASGSTPSFQAEKAGSYIVKLTVIDNLDVKSTTAQKVITTGPSAAGKAIFNITGLPGKPTEPGIRRCAECHKDGNGVGGSIPGTDLSTRSEVALKTAVTTPPSTTMGTAAGGDLPNAILALKEFLDSTKTTCP